MPQDNIAEDLDDRDLPLAWSMPKGDGKVVVMIPVKKKQRGDDKDRGITIKEKIK